MCGSAPGHWPSGFFFFKHSSPLLHMEQLLRTRYMWSFPMFAATGREYWYWCRSFSIALHTFLYTRVSGLEGTLRLLLPGRIYGCSTRHLVVLIFLALVPLTRGSDDRAVKLATGW